MNDHDQHSLGDLLIVETLLQENMMTASILSICVGPSILWSSDQAYMMDQNYSKEVDYTSILILTALEPYLKFNITIFQVSALVQILIEDYSRIFGSDTPDLYVQQVIIRHTCWVFISS